MLSQAERRTVGEKRGPSGIGTDTGSRDEPIYLPSVLSLSLSLLNTTSGTHGKGPDLVCPPLDRYGNEITVRPSIIHIAPVYIDGALKSLFPSHSDTDFKLMRDK